MEQNVKEQSQERIASRKNFGKRICAVLAVTGAALLLQAPAFAGYTVCSVSPPANGTSSCYTGWISTPGHWLYRTARATGGNSNWAVWDVDTDVTIDRGSMNGGSYARTIYGLYGTYQGFFVMSATPWREEAGSLELIS
jgi:hypothetical protein